MTSHPEQSVRPQVDSSWTHPKLAGTWTVERVTDKWIRLASPFHRAPIDVATAKWPKYRWGEWTAQ